MCHFFLNITKSKEGCFVDDLKDYDSMWIDDETYFKKINDNFFKFSDKFPLVTASMTELKKTTTNVAVTENLWKFYRNYILQNNIKPKSEILGKL